MASSHNSGLVIEFYGHAKTRPWCEFSNFYQTEEYMFKIPEALFGPETSDMPKTVTVRFAEASIMLCKALLMKDKDTFYRIAEAKTPSEAKKLGRQVRNWDQGLWDTHVAMIAHEAVYQKFTKVRGLDQVLLSTGNKHIAECSPSDRIWGIGMAVGDPGAQHPDQWNGQNLLGAALVHAREMIKFDRE